MNANELRDKLLATADLLAVVKFPPARTISCDAEIDVHGVNDRATLAAWVALMTEPKRGHSGDCFWVTGHIGIIKVSVFYKTGLLGEVVADVPPDFESLIAETKEHAEAQ